jgi:hypothetical protein
MKRLITLAVVAALFLAVSPLLAQRGRGGGSGGTGGMGLPGTQGTKQQDKMPKQDKRDRGPSVAEQLVARPSLASKLESELPPGTNLQRASQGFDDLGRFVAAVHVAHNLGIPFSQLRSKVVGRSPVSLGKAVRTLKPDAEKDAVKVAEKQAKQDIKDSRKQDSKKG